MSGWGRDDCSVRDVRPCTNTWRKTGTVVTKAPSSLSEPGWTASRCGGVCDNDLGTCYCNGTKGHIPAAPGSNPGTVFSQRGRPMILGMCNPSKDDEGNPTDWAFVDPELLYGPNGWCEADEPAHRCTCLIDGVAGPTCDEPTEMVCPNQCSGRGECWFGFCRCHDGWYGHDCAQLASGHPVTGHIKLKPWLRDVTVEPPIPEGASEERGLRMRPLIYVVDLPPIYNARMLQYRIQKETCAWRGFDSGNASIITEWTYQIEPALHEMLLQSPHRTLDPEAADFFYVPVYTSCFIHPVYGWSDTPWFHNPGGPRVMHAATMLLEAKRWLETELPYWNRTGGRDHIWLISHDEASCWAPSEIRPSIILSHWGRKALEHQSYTAYPDDNYSDDGVHPEWRPEGWRHIIEGHPCYNPDKDLIIPAFVPPARILPSPLTGAPEGPRPILLFFRGDVGLNRRPNYSRGIRQRLYALAKERQWRERHQIWIGTKEDILGGYPELLSSSMFCLVVPGDGWSPRAEDAMLHGCVPVVINDGVDQVFATVLDWEDFAVQIPESEMDFLPEILLSVSPSRLQLLQKGVRRVWHRFMYKAFPLFQREMLSLGAVDQQPDFGQYASQIDPRLLAQVGEDDAFATIMQRLYERMIQEKKI
ncbi:hypothetical protein WJX75_006916 [Coccomyxa subellipsoidea]|uniref:Exostosin GT47 domain-containing protein n=1 Tax=Coccomyxa subellipsoidea TaxID=248742 RepID=A0ABR2YQ78_9CHLO